MEDLYKYHNQIFCFSHDVEDFLTSSVTINFSTKTLLYASKINKIKLIE
jgi:hypothetical protein